MAEMLIVVAIIGVLSAVAFVAVAAHQRSMAQLEWDAVAKELFIAAQNHLTTAESQGYPGITSVTQYGTEATNMGDAKDVEGNSTVYYYKVSGGVEPSAAVDMFELMLPFGSVDETVRGGSYYIRYRTNPGVVLDVFYWSDTGSNKRYAPRNPSFSDLYNIRGEDKKSDRKKFLVGWYGVDEETETATNIETGAELLPPTIEVENAEKLTVTVINNGTKTPSVTDIVSLKLIITGQDSGAKAAVNLKDTKGDEAFSKRMKPTASNYTVTLDCITALDESNGSLHFEAINDSTSDSGITLQEESGVKKFFIPGENITVQAVAYSTNTLTNIAYSAERTTNSLFADVSKKTPEGDDGIYADTYAEWTEDSDYVFTAPGENDPWITAMIGSIRHLENLDSTISYLDKNDSIDADHPNGKLNITNAVQIADLDWKGIKDAAAIYYADATPATTDHLSFVPVVPSHYSGTAATTITLAYNGMGFEKITTPTTDPVTGAITNSTSYNAVSHSIKNIVVDIPAPVAGATHVVASGGLFDTLSGGSVKNLELVDFNVSMASGHAGTLAGTVSGNATISNVIAHNTPEYETELAKIDETKTTVKAASGNAGGLVGYMNAGTALSKCAAALIVNATGGDAGGLVGAVGTGTACTVAGCYSGGHTEDDDLSGSDAVVYNKTNYNVTATATGTAPNLVGGTAGGLIGNAGAAVITNSYSTCSVFGKYAGGFVGTGTGSVTNCYATGLVWGGEVTTETVTENEVETTKTTMTEKRDQEGAFAYSFSGSISNCNYFEIVNEREEKDGSGELTGGYDYLKALASGDNANIKALDETAAAFNDFSGSDWMDAVPYNTTLKTYYGEGTKTDTTRYILKTVEQLDASSTIGVTATDFVATHYGDWPAPEIFVINTK